MGWEVERQGVLQEKVILMQVLAVGEERDVLWLLSSLTGKALAIVAL